MALEPLNPLLQETYRLNLGVSSAPSGVDPELPIQPVADITAGAKLLRVVSIYYSKTLAAGTSDTGVTSLLPALGLLKGQVGKVISATGTVSGTATGTLITIYLGSVNNPRASWTATLQCFDLLAKPVYIASSDGSSGRMDIHVEGATVSDFLEIDLQVEIWQIAGMENKAIT